MAYCPQCGAECAENAAYCAQCGASIGAEVGEIASSNTHNSNPFAVGAQTTGGSSRYYDSEAPEIPGFGGAIAICFKKYCCFKGRASRSEYWYWTLFLFLVNVVLQILAKTAPDAATLTSALWCLTVFLPALAVIVRRLHDIDRSGWLYLIVLIPLIGAVILLVWFCRRGTEGENRFGLEPRRRG